MEEMERLHGFVCKRLYITYAYDVYHVQPLSEIFR